MVLVLFEPRRHSHYARIIEITERSLYNQLVQDYRSLHWINHQGRNPLPNVTGLEDTKSGSSIVMSPVTPPIPDEDKTLVIVEPPEPNQVFSILRPFSGKFSKQDNDTKLSSHSELHFCIKIKVLSLVSET